MALLACTDNTLTITLVVGTSIVYIYGIIFLFKLTLAQTDNTVTHVKMNKNTVH